MYKVNQKFSLESYIECLRNDINDNYSYNIYEPCVEGYNINTLESMINKDYNSIIKEMKNIDNFSKYSLEGIDIKTIFTKFINWAIDVIKRLIETCKTFIKFVIANISLLFTRSKQGLYRKFKNSVFTSLNLEIKDKPLHPEMINNINKFIDKYDGILANFNSEIDYANSTNSSWYKELDSELKEIKEIGVKKFISNIFYKTEEKTKMSIGDYFNCKVQETPKAIFVLSDRYVENLKETKKQIENLLFSLNALYGILLIRKKKVDISNEDMSKLKHLTKNSVYFYSMLYSFVIESLKVRKKVAKYILKGSLGKLFEQLQPENENLNDYELKVVEFEKYRDVEVNKKKERFILYENVKDGNTLCTIFVDKLFVKDNDNNIALHFWFTADSIEDPDFKDPTFESLINKLISLHKLFSEKNNNPLSNNHLKGLEILEELITIAKINIGFNWKEELTTQKFDATYQSIHSKSDQSKVIRYVRFIQRISIALFLASKRYMIKPEDNLFHSSENKNLSSLKPFHHSYDMSLFSEPRIYFNLNRLGGRYGSEITNNVKDFLLKNKRKLFSIPYNIYKVVDRSAIDGQYVYLDPEHTQEQRQSVYLKAKGDVKVENITDLLESLIETK